MSEANTDFTIGADPEFCILSGNKVEAAEDYSERNCFGADGGGIAFEIRPDYSTDPLRVVSNIHKTFLQLVRKEPRFLRLNWRAGSYVSGHPVGGHIHFGNLPSRPSVGTLCEWLDQFVGACTVLIEDPKEGRKRREAGYGEKGDHRTNDHGFEYRTASSWLTGPYIAAAVLCLAKTVVNEAILNPSKAPVKRIRSNDIDEMEVESIKRSFGEIWSDITKMAMYEEYQTQLDLINTLVNNKRTWFPKKPMKVSWGVVNMDKMIQQKKPAITLESIWKDVLNHKTV